MSILLIGLDEELMPVLIRRLMTEGDEVRVLEADAEASDRWRALGAHIASGPQWDADLIERAAQNTRTIVVGDRHAQKSAELMEALVEGGGFASREMRLVVVGDLGPRELNILRDSKLDYVVLGSVRRRGLLGKRSAPTPEQLAVAIDAADDLAGHPKLELDLRDELAWQELRLRSPSSR